MGQSHLELFWTSYEPIKRAENVISINFTKTITQYLWDDTCKKAGSVNSLYTFRYVQGLKFQFPLHSNMQRGAIGMQGTVLMKQKRIACFNHTHLPSLWHHKSINLKFNVKKQPIAWDPLKLIRMALGL